MLNQASSSVAAIYGLAAVDVEQLKNDCKTLIDNLPRLQSANGEVAVSPALNALLNRCQKLYQQWQDQFIAAETFALAVLDETGELAKVIKRLAIDKAKVDAAIQNIRNSEKVDSQAAEEQREALAKYTIDLTERARNSKLDPVIGRDDEIRRAVILEPLVEFHRHALSLDQADYYALAKLDLLYI